MQIDPKKRQGESHSNKLQNIYKTTLPVKLTFSIMAMQINLSSPYKEKDHAL